MRYAIVHDKQQLVDKVQQLEVIAQSVGLSWTAQQFADDLLTDHTYYGVCAAGFVAVSFVLDEAELVNIAVLPAYQGTGVAQTLWESVLAFFDEKHIRTCFLEVRESNQRAQRFYEKQGFSRVGYRKHYYHNPREGAVLYKWEKQ